MDAPRTAAALTNRGIAAERAGNRDEARQRFAEALAIDPAYEVAWLWYATVAEEPGERLYALNRALKLNPDSAAAREAAALAGVEPVVPADLADLAEPSMPPGFAPPTPGIGGRIRPGKGGKRVTTHPRRVDGEGRVRDARRPAKAAAAGAGGASARMWLLGGLAALLLVAALGAGWFASFRPQRGVVYVAFAGALSGPHAAIGREARDSATLYMDETNRAGGIDGREVQLLVYDDQGDPDVARQQAEAIVADGRAVLVIGHDTSETSLAAGAVYDEAGIASITGSATADDVTADRPWSFRTVFTNAGQGALMATYAARVLDHETASIVFADDDYGRSLRDSFAARLRTEGGSIAREWAIAEGDEAAMQQVADDLAADPDTGIVILATSETDARDTIVALRQAGVEVPIFGSDTLGTRGFSELFADLPEELERPGTFTDGVYAVSPYMYGAGGGRAVGFLERFSEAFGYRPDGWAVKNYDAAIAAVYAIDTADIAGARDALTDDRQQVRDRLAALDSLAVAIPSVEGPMYFDETRSFPQEIWIARFQGGAPVVAPTQYLPVADARRYDVDEEIAQGRMSEIDGRYFSPTHVVYTGLDINEISSLDTANETFVADFFVWFRYTGDEAVTNVIFPNAVNPDLALGDPLQKGTADGFTYAVYRVQGEFKEALDFIDYPWDRHDLSIRLQNAVLREDEVVYVVDQLALDQPASERLRSGLDVSQTINGIPNWEASDVFFYQDTVSSDSAMGDPRLSAAAGAVSYSQFVTDITIGRDVRSFLVKNLLPLAMLALVTYISLWFPKENAGARTGFAITAILTSAVLLGGVSSQLPDIGYTVAIEWGFYAYIALAAVLVVLNMSIERLVKQKRFAAAQRLDVLGRIMYPVVVLAVIGAYAVVHA